MPFTSRSTPLWILFALAMLPPTGALAQEPTKPEPTAENTTPVNRLPYVKKGNWTPPPILEFKDEIKPLPPVAIPDDPPPHEGAFFDLPLTIEPPDIIVVEVLEALPGRPITGERLVRPDGTISLGFYGDVHVRGLTPTQVKIKVILQLRKLVNDQTLGLLQEDPGGFIEEGMPDEGNLPMPKGDRSPFDLDAKPEKKPDPVPSEAPLLEKKSESETKPAESKEGRPSERLSRLGRPARNSRRRFTLTSAQDPPKVKQDEPPAPTAQPPVQIPPNDPQVPGPMIPEAPVEGIWTVVDPAASNRVFVDFSNHNSKTYFVQGDVGSPGRLPFTGKDTVLDALNYAGRLLPSGEPTDIHLYRPARGGQPAKDYKIDLDAIHKGVAKANLQIFPDDRLVVGRNPIVAKTTELDRALSPMNAMLNAMLQYSFTARSMAVMNNPTVGGSSNSGEIKVRLNGQDVVASSAPPTAMSQAEREALFKEWTEFFWSISSKESGAMLDEKAFKEALMKKLTPTPVPR